MSSVEQYPDELKSESPQPPTPAEEDASIKSESQLLAGRQLWLVLR